MLSQTIVDQVEHALRGLRYGTIQLVVHDARIVQIERLERVRLSTATDAGQPTLTGSPEALSTSRGRPTASPEARHGEEKE